MRRPVRGGTVIGNEGEGSTPFWGKWRKRCGVTGRFWVCEGGPHPGVPGEGVDAKRGGGRGRSLAKSVGGGYDSNIVCGRHLESFL